MVPFRAQELKQALRPSGHLAQPDGRPQQPRPSREVAEFGGRPNQCQSFRNFDPCLHQRLQEFGWQLAVIEELDEALTDRTGIPPDVGAVHKIVTTVLAGVVQEPAYEGSGIGSDPRHMS